MKVALAERHSLWIWAIAALALPPEQLTLAGDGLSPQQIFERRIMPIFKSPNPSSCTQCHLAGVDIKDYIQPSHEKTFLSLRDQGLIDLDAPERSKILRLIQMGERDTPAAALIHEATRKAEYDAFAEWIKASAGDARLREAPKLQAADQAGPGRPVEVIRHARKDRLLDSFEQNIWAMRFRCMTCHLEGSPENEKHKKEHGPRVAWMKAAGPEATMRYLIEKTDLIDTDNPERSLLLLKPLNEVKHGGGKKFLPGDLGYKAFRTWIEDYAAIVNDKYTRAEDLPTPTSALAQFGTEIWFKLTDTPPEWGDKLLLIRLFAWDERNRSWEDDPIAISDRGVWGQGRLWQHNLVLLAPRGSKRAEAWQRGEPTLPPGRYRVKVYVDSKDALAKQWDLPISEAEFVGKAEFTSRWPKGYDQMTAVNAAQIRP
jgi:hypothetical protein